ncbi:MAG: DUF4301 family protein [Bacteroidaceae bacterium]
MITTEDKEILALKKISEAQIAEQLKSFAKGFPFLKLDAAASIEKGILLPKVSETQEFLNAWDSYLKESGHSILKFVPASGAASRMFKDLFAFAESDYKEPKTSFEKNFIANLSEFAFYDELNIACQKLTQKDIPALLAQRDAKTIVKTLLDKEGLNYGQLPKGLLKFHSYPDGPRTPLEEHLVEGALYAASNGIVRLHFTVSPEHRELFEALVNKCKGKYEAQFGVQYEVSFSEQKSSTDTIAVDMKNEPFRINGKLLLRPGGHGALIENLNELDADVIFIKNIDNVVPDRLKAEVTAYKKLIAGVLVTLQKQAFEYMELLDSGKYTPEQVREIIQFVQKKFCVKNPETKVLEDANLVLYLKKKLNRPMRVCGMVKNVGEPGGGPFLAYNSDGTISLQILESSQIDMADPVKKSMFEKGTHFNPVDLVCAVKDYKGEKFDLTKFIDKSTGFISYKSKNGRELKALELPGLWNGAMSDWNTVFVEVSLGTFNPVKTVNDLLREQHQ